MSKERMDSEVRHCTNKYCKGTMRQIKEGQFKRLWKCSECFRMEVWKTFPEEKDELQNG